MGKVFISYRMLDDRFGAAAVYEILAQRLGADRVFRDCVSLQAGEHYPSAILDAVARSDVLLAIIGPDWLTLTDRLGRRLIDRRHDWVRREIAAAFTRGIPVVPVLLDGATQPTVAELPRDISRLALVQVARVSHKTVGADVRCLAMRLIAIAPGLAAPAMPAPAQLPADVCRFVGRRRQLARLRPFLDVTAEPCGPVVIAGPPGVGKTAMAIHLAHKLAGCFPDGQLFVNLRGFNPRLRPTTSCVLAAFLRALGVPPKGVPAQEDEQSTLFRSLLSGRRTLIVLDNAVAAGQIRPLLPNSPTCRVLVTSRDSLGELVAQDGAQLLRLDVLEPADAEELLAHMVSEPDRVTAEADAARDIARLCGYLPMALCIAGAKLRTRPTWRLAQVAERLADERRRLGELAVGDLDVRASFALSYQSLDSRHAEAFRKLGRIAGTEFTAAATAVLLGTTVEDAERLLEGLLDSHMVETGSQPGWYRFHDLLRLYARHCTHDTDNFGGPEKAIPVRGFPDVGACDHR